MRLLFPSIIALLLGATAVTFAEDSFDVRELRKQHKTQLLAYTKPPKPPADVFDLVSYPGPLGNMAAYVTPDPKDGKKHPLIIWRVGGFSSGIDEGLWEPAEASNDQTAAAYRKAGVAMMFPSLRGGNDNPGHAEGFFGEVDDIIAAGKYAATLPWVDPQRIYFGGHSTGGSLALLVAGSTDMFRAVFSFGPVYSVAMYGQKILPFDVSKKEEIAVRAPLLYLSAIKSPTFVLEGMEKSSNIDDLRFMRTKCSNDRIHFLEIPHADHFSVLAPFNALLAQKILADTGDACVIGISTKDISATVPGIVTGARK